MTDSQTKSVKRRTEYLAYRTVVRGAYLYSQAFYLADILIDGQEDSGYFYEVVQRVTASGTGPRAERIYDDLADYEIIPWHIIKDGEEVEAVIPKMQDQEDIESIIETLERIC